MFEYLYKWLQDISFYLILVTAATYVLPSGSYRKYLRFFTGLVLIALLLMPVMDLVGMEMFPVEDWIGQYEVEMKRNVQRVEENIEDRNFQNESVQIEVEEIIIEP